MEGAKKRRHDVAPSPPVMSQTQDVQQESAIDSPAFQPVKMATKESESKVQSGFVDNWQKGKSVIESLRYSLEEQILCDVTFIVGENRKRIQAHRFILSLRSCVFMAMLTGPLAEQDEIEIPDIDSDTFEQVLQCLYTDDIIIDGNNVVGLFGMCNKYNIDYLEKKCLKYIWQNGDAVLKSDSFCDLCHDCFAKVIEADQLKASEESVFEASIAWSEAECIRQGREVTPENRRSVIGDGIRLIRYSKINPNYFVQKVSQSSLLTEAEENKILRSFIIRGEDVSPFSSRYREGTNKTRIEINRFGNIKSTYSYSKQASYECIAFCLDTNAKLQGFNLYGSTKPSSADTLDVVTVSVCDATTDEIVSGSSVSKEIQSNKVMFDVDFPRPVQLSENKTYNLMVQMERKTGYNVSNALFYSQSSTEDRNYFSGMQGKSVVTHGSFTCSFHDYKECKHFTEENSTGV
ncbi:BTB/POZ domain-containing protein 2-like [Gigantopelta aegis]|uniref:BTB/POZ domain-containing protein 2-like n=2 Tax=Gigantopelta aegis TaxID=1735272 RepID=UPI001B88B01E|nr:BTB/POZ domain-containing protein 2-like [Gigantopelta aegis]